MIDVIVDTLIDAAKLLPFLYLAYLLMEFLEHRSGGAAERCLRDSGKFGPFAGALLGILPQCGFSAAASGLYAGRVVTTGTLIAVYLSTSDEMLPILISEGAEPLVILRLLGLKLAIGIAAGFAVDGVTALIRRKHPVTDGAQIEDICEREHCNCGNHFALSALKHTLRVAVFILIVTFALNTAVYLVGEDTLAKAFSENPALALLGATFVGLIPNCASSVILTELYLSGVLSLGAAVGGLLVNAGIGVAILFRNNRPVRDSFRVLAILYGIGLFAGFLIDLF